MLEEWRPLMCLFDVTMQKAIGYFELFLPTTLPPELHDKGFKWALPEIYDTLSLAQSVILVWKLESIEFFVFLKEKSRLFTKAAFIWSQIDK